MEYLNIVLLLLFHFIADFIYQTDEMTKNKSTSNKWLLKHTLTYTGVISIYLYAMTLVETFTGGVISDIFTNTLLFASITLVAHTLTDYVTSRVSSYFYKENKIHEFFVVIGLDQWLHALQIIVTYYLIFI